MQKIHNPKSRPKAPPVKPTCGSCRNFNAVNDDGGECRRYPPQAITLIDAKIGDRFPGVRKADIWCGEYRAAAKT